MLITAICTDEIFNIYRRFADAIGGSHWKKSVANCKAAIRGNEFLREYLEHEYEIAYQLCRLGELIDQYGTLPIGQDEQRSLYPAASFAAQALSLMDGNSKAEAEKLRRRIHGALKNSRDMRGLRLEIGVATHFALRGMRISWPEATGGKTFDLLVESSDHPPLEIECKSIADDKGRKLHKQEVLEFLCLLKPNIKSALSSLTTGISVVLTIPGRLPTAYSERVSLARTLGDTILSGNSCELSDGSTVRVSEFSMTTLGSMPNKMYGSELRQKLDSVTGTDNCHAVLIGTVRGGALAIALQSFQDDSLLKSVFKTLSIAVEKQLTGTRAGMLYVGLEGLNGEKLIRLAQQDEDPSQPNTGLSLATSQFLSSTSRNRLVGVCFASRSALRPIQDGLVESSGGVAYYFPKRDSTFWSESFSGMFA